jgi:hypothetical protein
MPLLFQEQSERLKLSDSVLEAGIVQTLHQFGFNSLVQKIPFVRGEGKTITWNVERSMHSGSSIQNPNSSAVNAGQSQYDEVTVSLKMLARDADVSLMDMAVHSNTNDQQRVKLFNSSKRLAFDFGDTMLNGCGIGDTPHGLAYFQARFGGFAQPNGSVVKLSPDDLNRRDRKVFFHDGDPSYESPPQVGTDSALPLTLGIMDDVVTRDDGENFDAIVVPRITRNWLKHLIRTESTAATPEMIMDEDFGVPMLNYEGIPIIRNDDVGNEKSGLGGVYGATISGTTLTVQQPGVSSDDTDAWMGFTDLDVGRTIYLGSLDESGEAATIVEVAGFREVELESTTSGSFTDADFYMPPVEAMQLIKFGEEDGFQACYAPNLASNVVNPEYPNATPIAGFIVDRYGMIQQGRGSKDQLTWIGTFKQKSSWASVRVSHYAAPAGL